MNCDNVPIIWRKHYARIRHDRYYEHNQHCRESYFSWFSPLQMTILYITEYDCKFYGVTFKIIGCIKVQNFEDISNDENTVYSVKPTRTFLDKSQVCNMTMFSGALNKSVFDGNTILTKISEETGKHKCVYIRGDKICTFMTSDNFFEYISNMGNNLCPYIVAIGEKNYYLLAPNFKFFEKDKIDYDTILDGMYPCDEKDFKKLEFYD